MREIKAVIFDLDDTLYEEESYVRQALFHTAEYMAEQSGLTGQSEQTGKDVQAGLDSLAGQHEQTEQTGLDGKVEQNGLSGQGGRTEQNGLTGQDDQTEQNDLTGLDEQTRQDGLTAQEEKREKTEQFYRRMLEILQEEGRGRIFNRVCEEFQVELPIKKLVEVYRSTRPVLQLYPDAEQLLEMLEKKAVKTGLITDGCSMVQRAKIVALSLDKRLDYVLATDDFGISKPQRAVYERCLEALGCTPEEAVYIGDNPAKDFCGAREIGMATVRIVRPKGMYMQDRAEAGKEADVTVHLLTELED